MEERRIHFQVGSDNKVRLTLVEGPVGKLRTETGVAELKALRAQLDQLQDPVVITLTEYVNGSSEIEAQPDGRGAEGSLIITRDEARKLRGEMIDATLKPIFQRDRTREAYVGDAGDGCLWVKHVEDDFEGNFSVRRGKARLAELADGMIPEGKIQTVAINVTDLTVVCDSRNGPSHAPTGTMKFMREEAMRFLRYVVSATMKEVPPNDVGGNTDHLYFERLPGDRIRLACVSDEQGSSGFLLERGTIDLGSLLEELRSFKAGCTLSEALLTLEVSDHVLLHSHGSADRMNEGKFNLIPTEVAALLIELERCG